MATWEDGPEYAPHQRPQSFSEPSVDPLEAPPPPPPAAGAPVDRPRFEQPERPVAPLVTLVPTPIDVRDPQQPFDVAAATMTGDSAWGSVHWNASQPFPVATSAPLADTAMPPASGPVGRADPGQPFQVQDGPAAGPTGFPAPGTPAWFSPPPLYGEQPGPARVRTADVIEAATPGLCVCLSIGGLIYVLAPIMLVIAVILSSRVRAGQRSVQFAFRGAAALLGLIGFASLFSEAALVSGWWTVVGLWALPLCWVMLVLLLVLVRHDLVRSSAPPPGPSAWG